MAIKLYEPVPPEVKAAPKIGEYTFDVMPVATPQPYADSEADFQVRKEWLPAKRGYSFGDGYSADPRPETIRCAEGTMQVTPEGFDSDWQTGPVGQRSSAAPFKTKK